MKDNGSNRVDQIKQRRRNTPIDKGNQADYGEDCSTDGTLTDAIQQTAWHRQRCAMGTLKDEDENLLENKLGLVQLFQYHAEVPCQRFQTRPGSCWRFSFKWAKTTSASASPRHAMIATWTDLMCDVNRTVNSGNGTPWHTRVFEHTERAGRVCCF